jgi:thiol-disulfide isomerase/thioredoxin
VNPEVGVRLLWAIAIIAGGAGLYWLIKAILLGRNSGDVRSLPYYRPGIPAILFFTSPTCAVCKTTQQPTLKALKSRLGDGIQVIEVDAARQPQLADAWGVMSVPATFVIDPGGQPLHANYGVASLDKLSNQVKKTF